MFLAASLFAPGAALATTSQPGIEMQASVNEQVTVRGKVLDAQGEPVIGANIRVKNHLGGAEQ